MHVLESLLTQPGTLGGDASRQVTPPSVDRYGPVVVFGRLKPAACQPTWSVTMNKADRAQLREIAA
jgi:hypothetical protein